MHTAVALPFRMQNFPPCFIRVRVGFRNLSASAYACQERGTLPNRKSDIYTMFTAAMIAPLPVDAREFLAVMGLADEFTLEMAHFITETPHTKSC